ncbi:hypothetical protein [Hymenobacter nivis]|uniref:hypothetical protein n=1 Tax=Hymenobacter nivis TaxID=1850093 RepID=UPI001B879125
MQAARAAGHPIGLGTGSGGAILSYILNHPELRQYFDAVVGEDDISKGNKPHPRYLRRGGPEAGRSARRLRSI